MKKNVLLRKKRFVELLLYLKQKKKDLEKN